jgi:long-chain acyl-CoA synthetase
MEVTRVFDLLDWLLEKYPKDDIINGKRDGEWINFSVNDYYKFSVLLSYGLHQLGLQKGDKIATITNNRPEFNIMDMAMTMLGIIHVPIYPTLTAEDYKYIINHSDAKMLVIGNKSIFSKVQPIISKLELEYGVYVLDKIEGQT